MTLLGLLGAITGATAGFVASDAYYRTRTSQAPVSDATKGTVKTAAIAGGALVGYLLGEQI